jgi:hypothetical protein
MEIALIARRHGRWEVGDTVWAASAEEGAARLDPLPGDVIRATIPDADGLSLTFTFNVEHGAGGLRLVPERSAKGRRRGIAAGESDADRNDSEGEQRKAGAHGLRQ